MHSAVPSSLHAFGFDPVRIVSARCATGRLLVPVRLDGEDVYFAIDTGTSESVVLSLPFAENRAFLVLGEHRRATRVPGVPQARVADVICPPFEALGRHAREAQVSAHDVTRYDSMTENGTIGPIAGSLGLGFFANGILGLDLQRSTVAFSEELEPTRPEEPSALYELSFARPLGGLMFLEGIRDGTTEQPLSVYFDSGVLTSALAIDTALARIPAAGLSERLFRRVLRWRFRRNVRKGERLILWPLEFNEQHEIRLGLWLVASLQAQADGSQLDRVDGWVGTDIVQNGTAVIDFLSKRFRVYRPS